MRVIPREVKKNITNSHEIRQLRANLELSEKQKQVLFGTLLGDGYITPNFWGKNYRLQIQHCQKQKSLVDWKYKIFQNFTMSQPKYDSVRKAWRFRTISHQQFTDFYSMFYKNRLKILPKDTIKCLTPLVLAVWFMDDGGKFSSPKYGVHGYLLNIQNFSLKEAQKIKDIFDKHLKIPSTLQKNKNGYRLYMKSERKETFKEMVYQHMLKDFLYKLS